MLLINSFFYLYPNFFRKKMNNDNLISLNGKNISILNYQSLYKIDVKIAP